MARKKFALGEKLDETVKKITFFSTFFFFALNIQFLKLLENQR